MQIRHAVLPTRAIGSDTRVPIAASGLTVVAAVAAYWRTGESTDSMTRTIVVSATADNDHSITVRDRETPFCMACDDRAARGVPGRARPLTARNVAVPCAIRAAARRSRRRRRRPYAPDLCFQLRFAPIGSAAAVRPAASIGHRS